MSNYVDHFPYLDGLLINYWDTSQTNDRAKLHPGAGLLLPIDAHYTSLKNVNGTIWRNRVQTYDSTFTLEPADALMLHVNSVISPISSQPAVRVFDDRILHYDSTNLQGSVIHPNSGTSIEVSSVTPGEFMQILIYPSKTKNKHLNRIERVCC